jgi:hypothetical protein
MEAILTASFSSAFNRSAGVCCTGVGCATCAGCAAADGVVAACCSAASRTRVTSPDLAIIKGSNFFLCTPLHDKSSGGKAIEHTSIHFLKGLVWSFARKAACSGVSGAAAVC